jgi:hypothetical protein
MSDWDGLVQIFNPNQKHFADERDRKRIEAQIPGSEGDPNKSWVDLDNGIVHLALPPKRLGSEWTGRPEDEEEEV